MPINLRRALLGVLALAGAYTGVWAYFAPRNWHARFPGFGRSWLPQLGPYNEHLSKDAGAMFLAPAVLTLFALRCVRNDMTVQITALVWLTFNIAASDLPHVASAPVRQRRQSLERRGPGLPRSGYFCPAHAAHAKAKRLTFP
ncbi:hypothetical protein [Streptomyces sp. NPDC048473]|uniref:hypothetical protein n=1 Tax=unclassified Streptomyces TaxID=2593676 RepID=UPI0037187AD1